MFLLPTYPMWSIPRIKFSIPFFAFSILSLEFSRTLMTSLFVRYVRLPNFYIRLLSLSVYLVLHFQRLCSFRISSTFTPCFYHDLNRVSCQLTTDDPSPQFMSFVCNFFHALIYSVYHNLIIAPKNDLNYVSLLLRNVQWLYIA